MGLLGAGGEFVKPELSGAALTTVTFQKMLPGIGGWIVTIGLIFFAYSTILGWCYYGEKCAVYVFGVTLCRTVPRGLRLFRHAGYRVEP